MQLPLVETCADASMRIGEALAGTAVGPVAEWLLVECRGQWPRDAADAEVVGLDREVVRQFCALPGRRLALIRRPQRQGQPMIFLVDVTRGETRGLPIGDIVSKNFEKSLREAPIFEGPIDLVCTHGRRDQCCAKHGVAFWRALDDAASAAALGKRRDRVWQSSHLGGHRFAATSVHLPSGAAFGRLVPSDAQSLLNLLERGAFGLVSKYRGSTTLAADMQVAAMAFRQAEEDETLAPPKVQRLPTGEQSVHMFRVSRGEVTRVIEVRSRRLEEPRAKSCGAPISPTTTVQEATLVAP